MDRMNVRIFGTRAKLDDAIPAFHSWIQQGPGEELLIDVVDYRHVPAGPGVVLIGHEADYGLSETPGGIALTYSSKARREGSDAEKLAAAFERVIAASARLTMYSFDRSACEVIINDRIGTPNTDANWQVLEQGIAAAFGASVKINRQGESRTRLTARVSSKTGLAVSPLRQTVAAL